MPEIIDPVFAKTSPKRSFCMTENDRFGLVFAKLQAGSLKMNTALEWSRVVQEGGRRCKKSTLNDLVHLTPLRIPLMNPPCVYKFGHCTFSVCSIEERTIEFAEIVCK